MLRIAHISDLHFIDHNSLIAQALKGFLLAYPEKILRSMSSAELISLIEFLRIVAHIKRGRREEFEALAKSLEDSGCDAVLITGDITTLAQEAEFEKARRYMERLESFARVILIPGNHDAVIEGFPEVMYALNKTLKTLVLKSKKEERGLERFFRCVSRYAGKNSYPQVHDLGEAIIVALNSVIVSPVFNFHGLVDEAQLKRLDGLLSKYDDSRQQVIVALHHTPVTSEPDGLLHMMKYSVLKLKNADELLSVIDRHRVAVVASGHLHEEFTVERSGTVFVSASMSSEAMDGRLSYPVYTICDGGLDVDFVRVPVESESERDERQNA